MAALREWIIRLWGTLRPGRRDAELEAELRLHVELATEDERRRAHSSEDAGRAASIRSGGMAQAMEAVRDQRGLPWLDDLARDLRYGLRALRRNPIFASVAVLTLALGIGANTAIFSLADAVLLRTLPVRDPRDLVMLRQRGPGGDIFPFTSAAASDLAPGRDALSGLAAFRPLLGTAVSVNGEAELATAQLVSGNYHAVLGVHAVLGRTLTEQDREPVAVISHGYWQRRFAGDSHVVGRLLEMQARSFTIVGVTAPEFFGTQPGRHVDVTAPLAAQTMKMGPNARWLYLIGRLAPGVSREQARAALRVRWAQLTAAQALPPRPPATLEVDAGAQGLNELRRQFSLPLQILMAAVAVVLLVACANLAGLLIVRASARQKEIAVRLSLGAARGRIVRQLLAESALLAAAGGAAGLALAVLGDRSAPRHDVPRARPDPARCRAERPHARVYCGGHDPHGRAVRSASGARRQPDRRAARAETERIRRRSRGECLGASPGGRSGRAARPAAHVGRPVCPDFAEAARCRRRVPPGPRARRERVDRSCVSRSQPACPLRGALRAACGVARRAVGQHDHGHAARRRAVDGRGDRRTRPSSGSRGRAAGLPQLCRPALLRDDGDTGAGGARSPAR